MTALESQDHVVVGFMTQVPSCNILERLTVGFQEVVWMGRQLSVPPDYDPCTAVPPPPTLPKLCSHVLYDLYRDNLRKVFIAISTLCMGEVDIEISNNDRVHTIWEVPERRYNVLGLGRSHRRNVAPNDKPLLLPRQQL